MALDLYQDESVNRLTDMRPVSIPEPGMFEGLAKGAGMSAMRGFARTARAIDMIGSVGPIAQDLLTGGTEAQDKYFKEHDEFFGRAVDYWTPKPGEVGAAGDVVGSLVSMLPMVVMSPSLTVAAQQMATSEELAAKGVSPGQAIGAGIAEGLGLGAGIWMPILGTNGWQRILAGGAGFNVLQGVVTRGAQGAILEGTPEAENYKAFDGNALTLDVLLGMAFGTLAHLSPSQRAQGAETWNKIRGFMEKSTPTQIDAIAALRQAQHLNVDSMPGKPVEVTDIDNHVQRMKQAIDDLSNDRPVNVEQMPIAKVEPDPVRIAEAEKTFSDMKEAAKTVASDEGIITEGARPQVSESPPPRGDEGREPSTNKLPTDVLWEVKDKDRTTEPSSTDLKKLTRDIKKNGIKEPVVITVSTADNMGYVTDGNNRLSAAKALGIDEVPYRVETTDVPFTPEQLAKAKSIDELGIPAETMAPKAKTAEAIAAEKWLSDFMKPEGEKVDPVTAEVNRIADTMPDMKLNIGTDAEGNPVQKTIRQFVDDTRADVEMAKQDATLFEIAARCLLGGGA